MFGENGGLIENDDYATKIAVVIRESAKKYLTQPSAKNEFEYMSLALHAFITRINPEDIVGYVISAENIEKVHMLMGEERLKSRKIWLVENLYSKEWENSQYMTVEYYL